MITKKELESHKLWVKSDGKKGKRLDKSDSFMNGADLRGANLTQDIKSKGV